ncbi:MAG: asparaginase [Nanoarchaeota archaeon]|nr:asparaginase [Nanoarchaeota archaeon]
MPKIALLTTGGTIAGMSSGDPHRDSEGHSVRGYRAGALSGRDLLEQVGGLEDIADIELEELAGIDSVEMNPGNWVDFAEHMFPYIERPDIDGIVLTHGTDTMAWTAMALAMQLQNPGKPIILTGAMLPPDQALDHVKLHLRASTYLAAHSGIDEVSVCFSGNPESTFTELYHAARVVKYAASAWNAFSNPIEEPLATFKGGKLTRNPKAPQRSEEGLPKLVKGFVPITQVTYVIGASPLPNNGNERGVLLDIPGRVGNNQRVYDYAFCALARGIPVAITGESGEYQNMPTEKELSLLRAGAAFMGRLNPHKAGVKLAWAIAQTRGDIFSTRTLMYKDIAGELAGLQLSPTYVGIRS